MRPKMSILFILLFLFVTSAAYATGEVRDRHTVYPDKTYNLYNLPSDPYERAKALHEITNNVSEGEGAYFVFNTLFSPSTPEQTSLRPGLTLNSQASPPYRLQGSVAIRDPYGLRVRKQGQKLINNQTHDITLIYAGGNRVYQWYNAGENPAQDMFKGNYLGFDGKGAKFFMDSIFMRGVLRGPRMEQLIKDTDATRIGMEHIKGTRTIVYGVQPTRQDFINGYRYLKIWVRLGDYRLVRTNLEMVHGAEFTEYSNLLTNIEFSEEEEKGFLLPDETLDQMIRECDMILYPDKYQVPRPDSTVKPQNQQPVMITPEGVETDSDESDDSSTETDSDADDS